jgi:hypothetical protein
VHLSKNLQERFTDSVIWFDMRNNWRKNRKSLEKFSLYRCKIWSKELFYVFVLSSIARALLICPFNLKSQPIHLNVELRRKFSEFKKLFACSIVLPLYWFFEMKKASSFARKALFAKINWATVHKNIFPNSNINIEHVSKFKN